MLRTEVYMFGFERDSYKSVLFADCIVSCRETTHLMCTDVHQEAREEAGVLFI